MKNVLELSVAIYRNSCTVFAYVLGVPVGALVICFDGFDDFTADENLADIKEKILYKFQNPERESLAKVLASIRICIDEISK